MEHSEQGHRVFNQVSDHLEIFRVSRMVWSHLIIAVDQGAPVQGLQSSLKAEHGFLVQAGC